jgi:hypothetical protein
MRSRAGWCRLRWRPSRRTEGLALFGATGTLALREGPRATSRDGGPGLVAVGQATLLPLW